MKIVLPLSKLIIFKNRVVDIKICPFLKPVFSGKPRAESYADRIRCFVVSSISKRIGIVISGG